MPAVTEDNMEGFPAYINILMYIFVVMYMLSVPLETTRGEIIKNLNHFKLIGRALLANVIIIPILGFAIARILGLPRDIKIGFLLLSMAPGGLFALQFARVSNGNRVFAVALLFLFCLLSILIVPELTFLFFPIELGGKSPLGWLIMMLFLLVILPVAVGRVLQTLIPRHAPGFGLWLGRLSIVFFVVSAVAAAGHRSAAVKLMGNDGIAAIVVLILASWIVGWLLGGPDIGNRKVLAISTSMRNVGVCLPIASNYFSGMDVVTPMLAFSGVMIPMNMVFAFAVAWASRDRTESVSPVRS